MARELRWNNVSVGNPNAGSQYALAGADLLTKALQNLNKPIEHYNEIQKQNAESQSKANTGTAIDAIMQGKKADLSGLYDANAVAEARRNYTTEERKFALEKALRDMQMQKYAHDMAMNNLSDADKLKQQLSLYGKKRDIDLVNELVKAKEMAKLGLSPTGKSLYSGRGGSGKGRGSLDALNMLNNYLEKTGAGKDSMDPDSKKEVAASLYSAAAGDPDLAEYILSRSGRDTSFRGFMNPYDEYQFDIAKFPEIATSYVEGKNLHAQNKAIGDDQLMKDLEAKYRKQREQWSK